MMVSQMLVSVQVFFVGAERDCALSIFSLAMGTGRVARLLMGGVLTSTDTAGLGRRAAFLVNVPVGLMVVLLDGRWIPHPGSDATKVHLGTVDMAWMAVSMAAVLLPLLFGRELRWPV